MSAEEAVEYGLIDTVLAERKEMRQLRRLIP